MSAKLCKYGCGQMLTWDNSKRKFIEPDGTEHVKERCESLKKNTQSPATNFHNETPSTKSSTNSSNQISQMHQENIQASKELAAAIRELTVAIIRSRQPI